jgi:hypothetical protein
MELSGTDVSTFTADTDAQQAVIAAFADNLDNTSADDVRIVNVTALARRRLSHASSEPIHLRMDATPLSAGLTVTLEVLYILEALGLAAEDSAALFSAMSSQASTAVTSGAFATALTTQLTQRGSSAALTVNPATFTVGSFTVLVVATPFPTRFPTLLPSLITTLAPTVPTAGAGAGASAAASLSLGAVAGIVVGAVCLLGLVLGAVYWPSMQKWNSAGNAYFSAVPVLNAFIFAVCCSGGCAFTAVKVYATSADDVVAKVAAEEVGTA